MGSKQFIGTIKGFRVSGEDEPEIVLTVAIPLTETTVGDLSFLGGVKRHGPAVLEIQSAQSELPLEAEPATLTPIEDKEPVGATP